MICFIAIGGCFIKDNYLPGFHLALRPDTSHSGISFRTHPPPILLYLRRGTETRSKLASYLHVHEVQVRALTTVVFTSVCYQQGPPSCEVSLPPFMPCFQLQRVHLTPMAKICPARRANEFREGAPLRISVARSHEHNSRWLGVSSCCCCHASTRGGHVRVPGHDLGQNAHAGHAYRLPTGFLLHCPVSVLLTSRTDLPKLFLCKRVVTPE